MEPRDAATVILVRDGSDGLEVLLLRRRDDSGFVPGAYVFPGGAVDPHDAEPIFADHCAGLDDATASRRVGVQSGGLAFWVAGIRETFEEAGLLLAYDANGDLVSLVDGGRPAILDRHRRAVDDGTTLLADLCASEDLTLATDRLRYFGRWITPHGAPRRYDTYFFVAVVPEAQEAAADNRETVEHRWITPRAALAAHADGGFELILPTYRSLTLLDRFDGVESLLEAVDRAQGNGSGPHLVDDHGGWRLALDDHELTGAVGGGRA